MTKHALVGIIVLCFCSTFMTMLYQYASNGWKYESNPPIGSHHAATAEHAAPAPHGESAPSSMTATPMETPMAAPEETPLATPVVTPTP